MHNAALRGEQRHH
ncbi:hypothetical protein D018_3213A, partial [Vibrio parahaemolyticus VP2007-007]